MHATRLKQREGRRRRKEKKRGKWGKEKNRKARMGRRMGAKGTAEHRADSARSCVHLGSVV